MKKLSLKILGVLVILIMLVQTSVVFAASTNDLKNQQGRLFQVLLQG